MSRYSTTSSSTSIYRALRQEINEIRLFHIHAAQNPDDPIEGELVYVDLSNAPSFYALSYLCGDPIQDKTVIVDGLPLKVVSNCEQALKRLRNGGIGIVWVDQVCIDQDRSVEKSGQILRIASVYQEASGVVIWLGPHADGSAELLKRNLRNLTPENLRDDPSLCRQVRALFMRNYWKRAWIVQEIAAATELELWCGNSMIDWECIEHMLDTWLAYQLQVDPEYAEELSLYEQPTKHEAEPYSLQYLRTSRNQGQPLPLLKLLQIFHRSEATDTRDKVYALLGLAWDRFHYITEPSYSIPSEKHLCLDMTKACMIRKRSLDVMFLAGLRKMAGTLPSWCPNYISLTADETTTNLSTYLASREERIRSGIKGYRWLATAGSFAMAHTFHINDTCLSTQARFVDTITGLGKLRDENGEHRHDDRKMTRTQQYALLASISRAMALYDKNYARYQALPEQPSTLYLSTFRLQGHRSKVKDKNEYVKEWRDRHRGFRLGSISLEQLSTPTERLKSELQPEYFADAFKKGSKSIKSVFDPNLSWTASMNYEAMTGSLYDIFKENLRFTVTEKFRVGWAHSDAQVSDNIFLIPGCSMPVILRRSSTDTNSFRVVGHCYIDGLMDGKLWQSLSRSEGVAPFINIV